MANFTIEINNQTPAILSEEINLPLASTLNVFDEVKTNLIDPLYKPLVQGHPVEMKITENGKTVNFDTNNITDLLFKCSDDRFDPENEERLCEIFAQTLVYFDKTQPIRKIYATQAGLRLGMHTPSSRVIYGPRDVNEAAKLFLANQISADAWFANLAYYTKTDAFGYYFTNSHEFEKFKTFFMTETAKLSSVLPPETQNLIKSFKSIFLNGLTESLILRDDETQNNDPYSFARTLLFFLNAYKNNARKNKLPMHTAGSLPFTFSESILPKNLIFVNVEKHAHATLSEIEKEWAIINSAIAMRPKLYSLNQIQKLTTVARMAKRMSSGTASLQGDALKSAQIKFSSKPLTSVDLYKKIISIYKHATFVQRSENSVKYKKITYNKASRRHPDNPDIPGRAYGTKYKPDLHIYLDCSGSISERDYKDAIMSCIKLATKLGINFYMNSFSHVLSQSAKLPVAGKSPKQIYEIFKTIPKVTGGTDYEQIWHFINRSEKLSKQVSIVITDFEWTAPNHYVKHPKYLYYAPISANPQNWRCITNNGEHFLRSMSHIDPYTRKKILM